MKIFSVENLLKKILLHLKILILRVLQGFMKGLLTQSYQSHAQNMTNYHWVQIDKNANKSYETFTLKLLMNVFISFILTSTIRTMKNRVPVHHDGFTASRRKDKEICKQKFIDNIKLN